MEDKCSDDRKSQRLRLCHEKCGLTLPPPPSPTPSLQCHIKLADLAVAVEWLHKAYNMPTTSPEVRPIVCHEPFPAPRHPYSSLPLSLSSPSSPSLSQDHKAQKEVEELLTQHDPSFTDSTA